MSPRRPVSRLTASWKLWVLVLLVSGALYGCEAGQPEEHQILHDALKTNFPTWKMVSERDLSSEQLAAWKEAHPGQEPGLASGDYFGDSTACSAVLLTKQGEEGRRMRVIVMKPNPAGRFETFVLFTESPVDSTPQIFTSRAGEYEVFLEGRAVPVPTEGVVYARGDGRQKLFFWNIDRFQDIELTR